MDIAIAVGLDLIILAIFVVSIMIGMHRGLLKSLISFAGKIAALIIALIFSAQLGGYISSHFVEKPVREWLVNQMTADPSDMDTEASEIDFDQLIEDSPDFFKNICSYFGVDMNQLAQEYEEFKYSNAETATENIINYMVQPVALSISRVIAFLILFIICMIAVGLLWWLSSIFTHIPIIRHFDKAGGAIFGVLSGLLISFIVVAIIHICSPYVMKDHTLAEKDAIFNRTVVYKQFYNHNPLTGSFSGWIDTASEESDGQ